MPKSDLSITPQEYSLRHKLGNVLWYLWDSIFLLQMGQAYLARFRDFSDDGNVESWRKGQQEEWDRLSTVLALLATMHAAILAITPHAPPFAFAVWLGGAGLSICGVFIVQYFPIKAFPISDEDIRDLVQEKNHYVNVALLAAAVASPVIIMLWASIMFAVGIFDYLVEADLGGKKYRIIALVPFGLGILAVVATLTIGEKLGRRIEARRKQKSLTPSPLLNSHPLLNRNT